MTTFQLLGTVNVSLPSLKPLKFKPPFSCVRPAVSWNVAVFVALSTVSQVQSICGDCVGGFCAPASDDSEMTNPLRSEASRFMRRKLPSDPRRPKDPDTRSGRAPARRTDPALH